MHAYLKQFQLPQPLKYLNERCVRVLIDRLKVYAGVVAAGWAGVVIAVQAPRPAGHSSMARALVIAYMACILWPMRKFTYLTRLLPPFRGALIDFFTSAAESVALDALLDGPVDVGLEAPAEDSLCFRDARPCWEAARNSSQTLHYW